MGSYSGFISELKRHLEAAAEARRKGINLIVDLLSADFIRYVYVSKWEDTLQIGPDTYTGPGLYRAWEVIKLARETGKVGDPLLDLHVFPEKMQITLVVSFGWKYVRARAECWDSEDGWYVELYVNGTRDTIYDKTIERRRAILNGKEVATVLMLLAAMGVYPRDPTGLFNLPLDMFPDLR